MLAVVVAAAFKAGKIQNNPFSQASTSGGAAIPPPTNLAGIMSSTFLESVLAFYLFFFLLQHLLCSVDL